MGGTTKKTLIFRRGTNWEVTAGISLAKLGLEASISAGASYEREVVFSYELSGHYRFVASRYTQPPVYLWSVDQEELRPRGQARDRE